jgi:hypothetical protein
MRPRGIVPRAGKHINPGFRDRGIRRRQVVERLYHKAYCIEISCSEALLAHYTTVLLQSEYPTRAGTLLRLDLLGGSLFIL